MLASKSDGRKNDAGHHFLSRYPLLIDDWRAQAFYILFFAALIIETTSAFDAIQRIRIDHWGVAPITLLAVAFVSLLLALFWRSRTFETRIWLGIVSLYLYGLALLGTIGPISGGRTSLLAAALAACVLISVKSGLILLSTNLAVLLLLGGANHFGLVHWDIYGFTWENWVISTLSHTILATAIVLAMASLIKAQKNSLETVQSNQAKLERRLKMEQLVANISSRIGSASADQLEKNSEWALQAIGEAMQVDRAYLFAVDSQNRVWNNTHEWCAEGVASQIRELQNISMNSFVWWTSMLTQGQPIIIGDISTLEETNPVLYEALHKQEIQSLLAVPLVQKGTVLGFIGFDMVREKRSWNIGDISLLRTIAGVIARSKGRANNERELAESERRYRMLVENAPIGVMLLDQEGAVLETNPGVQSLGEIASFGLGQNLLGVKPFADAGFSKQFQRCLLGDEYCSGEINYQMLNEAPRWARYHIANMQIDQNQPKRVLMIVEDTSDEHALQETLNRSQRMEALGRLAGGVAHDFNNLLTIIKGYVEMILDNPQLEPEIKSDLLSIDDASNKASALTSQLLLFSRRQETQRENLDLNQLITDTSRMLERLIGESVKLQLDLPNEPCEIYANQGQIEQVIMNLVVNARDAMPEGGTIHIGTRHIVVSKTSARATPSAKAGPYVQIYVQDTGTGMSPEVLQHIFEPFYTTKAANKGTGLGLATVYGIVTQAGGHIVTESHLNRGTTFFVNFPPAEHDAPLKGKSPREPQRAVERTAAAQQTILVVEDDATVRQLIVRALAGMGYAVHDASDGEDALTMIRDGLKIDLVISDVVMPGLSGIKLTRALQEVVPTPPIVLMSGYPQELTELQDLLDEGVPFLLKPVKRQELLEVIQQVLQQPPFES